MPRLLRRKKSKHRSARSAWAAIAKRTGIKRSTHKLKRQDTKQFYQWSVGGRKKTR